jgi:DNA mismatch endonuclease (patch repair protein)
MTDVHTPEQRRRNMSAIKGKNTRPEMVVRTLLHSMGYRYRLHRKDLPGKPDIVLAKHRIAIFVNGCFWHRHECRWGTVTPKTRPEFWAEKRASNVVRDEKKNSALEKCGWKVVTVWECETRDNETLLQALKPLTG